MNFFSVCTGDVRLNLDVVVVLVIWMLDRFGLDVGGWLLECLVG